MVGKESFKERPVFIPPRKRQSTKKTSGQQNYVDHIVSATSRQKPSPTGLEDALIKTSLLLKNKQPLPQIPKEPSSPAEGRESIDIFDFEDHEMQSFENITASTRRECSTVPPNSYSESRLQTAKQSKSQDCLTTRSSSEKRVNIRTEILQSQSPRDTSNAGGHYEDLESGETSALNAEADRHNSFDRLSRRSWNDRYLTMTGTIKRGRQKGQSVDLKINISRDELEKLNAVLAAEETKKQNLCIVCSVSTGLHILLLSIICLPFVAALTSIYSFYIGTLTWYNMFNFFNEESLLLKLSMSPILIITYPFAIIVCSLGLGIYSGFVQLSLQFNSWINEVGDIEKGFYGWLCGILKLSDCSPYEVVILTDLKSPGGI